MNHDYYLMGRGQDISNFQKYKVIDNVIAKSIKEAEKLFKQRNNLQILTEKYNLSITKTERWLS